MHFSTISILAFLATGAVATPVPSPNGDALQTVNEAHLLARAGVPPQENPCTGKGKVSCFFMGTTCQIQNGECILG
ncbi:hypothetical protein MGG_18035 [Pyricularia oryzae 70-15]|uniref:Uncharacterized protein n=4 Tax=Pyricularia oryzae TaxID=318829 RepID=G5EHZ0_PYRO7|nr:uncharacterized protein MGG_18035 [Pyricularia oryzae 70-15]AEX97158.1 hypothetical protein 7bg7.23 [Pyricularia oryzae]ELQ34247.1 hypothetical protein OOU_Y34scaffold00777g5 [Pyricularia oryzae Y34]EAQ70833.1 hypothetical protein MGCH7_ch7g240 [Pyricularia oryzae 70-15]EHA46533.1 hypothetical protein MGG_18035 [Pyricularia oryzae 70-15]KAI6465884.1 hypothetical protein MCOR15_003188 [Pyricularia oryzae]